jgi:hypothetical protein
VTSIEGVLIDIGLLTADSTFSCLLSSAGFVDGIVVVVVVVVEEEEEVFFCCEAL